MPERVFIPWGEFKPDSRLFGGDAMSEMYECFNVLPIAGSYYPTPMWVPIGSGWTSSGITETRGFHVHPTGPATWAAYMGDVTKLYSLDMSSGIRTDMSRLVGGAYTASGAYGWQGTSFGDSVILTDFFDDPQILLNGGANFQKLATSTFAPKARFVASLKNNAVMAHCRIAAPYDTLLAQDYPQLVCWSQDDNARAWGSPNVDPQLLGADFQLLLNDYGSIAGLIGGEFVLIAQQRGWVRMEGPAGSAFSFRPIVTGTGCAFPLSIVYFDGDVYFWGPAGPSRLRGGEGPVEVLGTGSVMRTLTDNSDSGFGKGDAIRSGLIGADVRHMAATADPVNRIIKWCFTCQTRGQSETGVKENGNRWVAYNVDERRWSMGKNVLPTMLPNQYGGALYPRTRIDTGDTWLPFGMDVAILQSLDTVSGAFTEFPGVQQNYIPTGETIRMGKPFIQLDPKRTTRILRMRPVFARGLAASVPSDFAMAVELASCNRSYEVLGATTYRTRDRHGWITTPTSATADFHQPVFVFEFGASEAEDLYSLVEPEGIEIEYLIGGAYGE